MSGFSDFGIERNGPVNMILGTDWWSDCDDAVALRLLLNAQKQGLIKLLGVVINACMDYSVDSLDAFVRQDGFSDIPIGIDLSATDFSGEPPYQKKLSELYGTGKTNKDAFDAVKLYRKLLASASGKVDLVEIGFLQAVEGLLKSEPDEYSDLNGYELVKSKVNKLWVMAGNWESLENGKEHNFSNNQRASRGASYVCEHFPGEITFLGWEASRSVITGGELLPDDVLKKVLVWHGSGNGRYSWDPMLALLAVVGDEKKAGYDFLCGKAEVDEITGENRFTTDADGNHRIVRKIKPDSFYKNAINEIIYKK